MSDNKDPDPPASTEEDANKDSSEATPAPEKVEDKPTAEEAK